MNRLLLCAIPLTLVLLVSVRPGESQAPKAEAKPQMIGAVHCAGCHGGSAETIGSYRSAGYTGLIRFDEHAIWKKQDPHAHAFDNLDPKTKPLAARMQELLRKDPARGETYEIQKAAECLTCHAVDQSPKAVTSKDTNSGRFHVTDGVSCEACHGFADGWLGKHVQLDWRDATPTAKRDAGMIFLRSPKDRAENCLSCHVGNTAQGKFVTHAMYAAGHPPLPPFELSRYGLDQPAHNYAASDNAYLKELAEKNAVTAWEKYAYAPSVKNDAASRDTLIGSLVRFREELRLIHDEAVNKQAGGIMDYATFDCMACHHDLKNPSERQERGMPGIPGRPVPKLSSEIAMSAAKRLGKEADLLPHVENLKKAYDRRVFGDRSAILVETEALIGKLNTLISAAEKQTFPTADAITWRAELLAKLKSDPAAGGSGPYIRMDADEAKLWRWSLECLGDRSLNADTTVPAHVRDPQKAGRNVADELEERLKKSAAFSAMDFMKAFGPKGK